MLIPLDTDQNNLVLTKFLLRLILTLLKSKSVNEDKFTIPEVAVNVELLTKTV